MWPFINTLIDLPQIFNFILLQDGEKESAHVQDPEEENDKEEGWQSDKDIFADYDNDNNSDQVEQENMDIDSDYSLPPSQSIFNEELPGSNLSPLPGTSRSIGEVDLTRDSGCATQTGIVSDTAEASESSKSTCKKCGRPQSKTTIKKNVSVCVNQCSEIQINIQLSPCQSECANRQLSPCQSEGANRQLSPCQSEGANRTCRDVDTDLTSPDVADVVDLTRDADGDEAEEYVSLSEPDEDKMCANRSEDEADGDSTRDLEQDAFDDDWPEEAALLASMAAEDSQVDVKPMIGEQNLPEVKSEIETQCLPSDTKVQRSQLARPSYREQSNSNQEVIVKTEIKSEAIESGPRHSQTSNFGKFLAPVKNTFYSRTKGMTQTSIASFFTRWTTGSNGSTKPKSTIKIETGDAGTSQGPSGSGVMSAGPGQTTFGGSGSSRSYGKKVRGRGGVPAFSAGDSGIDSRYGRPRKPCPFYKKMPGKLIRLESTNRPHPSGVA